MPTKGIRPGPGTLYFNGVKYTGMVTDYTYDGDEYADKLTKYVEDTFYNAPMVTLSVQLSRVQLLKIIGLWDLTLTLCPDRRVKHFMQHGSDRVKIKNFYHACRLIGRMAKEEK